ncbi:hypothetical protein [Lentzea albida]|uniref:Uncharacterized protein n=1 Tax=Lentzea albida TaxID=65499 RepID=A0A1H9X3T7_9PSEU|nr:hypothetical protein [Lentzea albida]SES40729.1 hypothetical protein SAMN04488000_12725 [Lentzea albida]
MALADLLRALIGPITGAVVGTLVLGGFITCDVLSLRGADLRIVVFTAAPDSEAADQLRFLTVIGHQDMTSSAPGSTDHAKDPGLRTAEHD